MTRWRLLIAARKVIRLFRADAGLTARQESLQTARRIRPPMGRPRRDRVQPSLLRTVLVAGVLLALAGSARAVVFELTKVVSEGDAVSGLFVGQGSTIHGMRAPALDGENLGFYAFTDEAVQGYFIYDALSGAVRPAGIAGDRTTGPLSLGGFNRLTTFAGFPSMSAGVLAGWAADNMGRQHIITSDGTTVTEAANTGLIFNAAGDDIILQDLGRNPSIRNGTIAFRATATSADGSGNKSGIYTGGGELPLVVYADGETEIRPPGQHIVTFGDPSFDGDRVVFRGVSNEGWVQIHYRTPTIGGTTVNSDIIAVNDVLPFPQAEGRFVLDGSTISQPLIRAYDRLEDSYRSIVTGGTEIPGSSGLSFSNVEVFSGDQEHWVFQGGTGSTHGIYSKGLPGSERVFLSEVITTGAILDGKSVRSLAMQPDAVSGSRIALMIEFTDNTRALYVAQPRPTMLPESGARASADVHYGNLAFAPEDQDYSENVTDPVFADVFGLRGPIPLEFDEAFAHGSGYILGRDGQGTPTVHALSRAQGTFFRGPTGDPRDSVASHATGTAVSLWQPRASGAPDEPIDVDVTVELHGLLDISHGSGDFAPDFITSRFNFDVRLVQESLGDFPIVYAQATLDSDGELSGTLFEGHPEFFTPVVSEYEDGTAYRVDAVFTIEDVTLINPGGEDRFAIELTINTEARVFDPGGDELGAVADFLNSGSYSLSSDTPGVTFVQIIVPEPTAPVLLLAGILAVPLAMHCRRIELRIGRA